MRRPRLRGRLPTNTRVRRTYRTGVSRRLGSPRPARPASSRLPAGPLTVETLRRRLVHALENTCVGKPHAAESDDVRIGVVELDDERGALLQTGGLDDRVRQGQLVSGTQARGRNEVVHSYRMG